MTEIAKRLQVMINENPDAILLVHATNLIADETITDEMWIEAGWKTTPWRESKEAIVVLCMDELI